MNINNMNNQINFTEFNKMAQNGIWCSFVSDDDDKPIQFTIKNVSLPLGISDYSNKLSVLINLTEEIPELNKVYELAQKRFRGYTLENPHKKSDKYPLQIKCNLNKLTHLFDDQCNMIEDYRQFEKHCKVSVIVKVSTVWSKNNKTGGISMSLVQMKMEKKVEEEKVRCEL